jgi:hypothetical protein
LVDLFRLVGIGRRQHNLEDGIEISGLGGGDAAVPDAQLPPLEDPAGILSMIGPLGVGIFTLDPSAASQGATGRSR